MNCLRTVLHILKVEQRSAAIVSSLRQILSTACLLNSTKSVLYKARNVQRKMLKLVKRKTNKQSVSGVLYLNSC